MKISLLCALGLAAFASAIPTVNEDDLLFSRAVNDKCRAPLGTGTCQHTSKCPGISYPANLCPKDPADVQCCVKITCKVPKAGSGYCRSVKNNGCPGGKFHTGFCPGSSDIKCCVKTSAPKPKPKPKPLPKPDPCSSAVVERLVFQDNISTFLAARGARRPGCFDWDSDGCSWAPDGFGAFNFKPACYRHDFGYRNTKRKRTFNPTMKDRIDRKFKSDMDDICSKERNFLVRKACQFAAGRYYNAVKEFGKRDDTNEVLEDEIFI